MDEKTLRPKAPGQRCPHRDRSQRSRAEAVAVFVVSGWGWIALTRLGIRAFASYAVWVTYRNPGLHAGDHPRSGCLRHHWACSFGIVATRIGQKEAPYKHWCHPGVKRIPILLLSVHSWGRT